MGPFDATIGAAAFWLFVAAVSIAGTYAGVAKHRETQRTIREAMERGMIDASVLDRLSAGGAARSRPEDLLLGGAVTMAVGLGLGALAFFIGLEAGRPIYPLIGAGVMCALIGAVLVGFALWRMRRPGATEPLGWTED